MTGKEPELHPPADRAFLDFKFTADYFAGRQSAGSALAKAPKKGSGAFYRNGPEGASRKRLLTFFSDDESEVLLVAWDTRDAVIERIDPRNCFKAIVELDVRDFLTKQWGRRVGISTFAYNDMLPITHPDILTSLCLLTSLFAAARRHGRDLPGVPRFEILRAGSCQALKTLGAMASNDWN